MFEHAAHLTVLSLPQGHRDPGIAALSPLQAGTDRAIGHAVDRDSLFERSEPLRLDVAMDAYLVAPLPAGRRQFKPSRQRAIIGQQQEPLGAEVEPADRNQPGQILRQGIENRRAAFLVVMRGNETCPLVITP